MGGWEGGAMGRNAVLQDRQMKITFQRVYQSAKGRKGKEERGGRGGDAEWGKVSGV